jgi:hypothetical protein
MEEKVSKTIYCMNGFCNREASDAIKGRPLCIACVQAYTWGGLDVLKGMENVPTTLNQISRTLRG